MTTVSNIQGNITATVSQKPDSFLDRVIGWMNHVVEEFCCPVPSDTVHENLAAEYLFLNPSCCGAGIDSELCDLLIDQRSQPVAQEASNLEHHDTQSSSYRA